MSRGHGDVSLAAAFSLASLLKRSSIEVTAVSGPAGVVAPSNDPRKAILMNCTHPSPKPSIIHPSIYHFI